VTFTRLTAGHARARQTTKRLHPRRAPSAERTPAPPPTPPGPPSRTRNVRAAWPRRPWLYRCVAKDGTVAAVLVAATANGPRVVELITVGRIEPPARRPRPQRIADDFRDLARRAEQRRLEQLARLHEELRNAERGAA
jgi:hypothetical protein